MAKFKFAKSIFVKIEWLFQGAEKKLTVISFKQPSLSIVINSGNEYMYCIKGNSQKIKLNGCIIQKPTGTNSQHKLLNIILFVRPDPYAVMDQGRLAMLLK